MKGTRVLVLLGVVAFAGVWVQRARSPFLRIERETAIAESIALDSGLSIEEACALRELLGVDRELAEVVRIAKRFQELRRDGDDAVALFGAVAPTDVDPERERSLLARRFAAMTERFAARRRAR